jgi:hypothetical protein
MNNILIRIYILFCFYANLNFYNTDAQHSYIIKYKIKKKQSILQHP